MVNFNQKININILYLYDIENWAIHNVGKAWLNDSDHLKVIFKKYNNFTLKDYELYDYIWFGYSDLFLNFYLHHYIKNTYLNKTILAIHDPMEIFPEYLGWKNIKMNLMTVSYWRRYLKIFILKRANIVITTSIELHEQLKKLNFDCNLIPTYSTLPSRRKNRLITNQIKILSIYNPNERKNPKLLNELSKIIYKEYNIPVDIKEGIKVLSTRNYIKYLDKYSIYICTSHQEGGPLPAMDALKRGCVILTTPVGQIQEIITNGYNGFICNNEKDFLSCLKKIVTDKERLHKMKLNSIMSINQRRNKNKIRKEVFKIISTNTNKSKLELLTLIYFVYICMLVLLVNLLSKQKK